MSSSSLSPFLHQNPLVVGSLNSPIPHPAHLSVTDCDLVELRLDAWEGPPLANDFARQCPLPILITCRDHAEGGVGLYSPQERLHILHLHLSCANALDVEIANLSLMESIWDAAQSQNLLRVASAHDFHKPMNLREMNKKIEIALKAGADIVKFAFHLSQTADLDIGLQLLKQWENEPVSLSVMGMGTLGPRSRVLYAQHGSLLNYGYLGSQPTAPGQLSAPELRQSLEKAP